MQRLIDMANNLGLELKASPEFLAYESCRRAHDEDDGLQGLIGEFNLKRQMLIQENGKEEDRCDADLQAELQKAMRELYGTIMENQNMKAYVEAKKKLDALVGEIFDTLNFHINGQRGGCGGSCSSCSGCR